MKRFLEVLVAIKYTAAMSFTGMMALYLVASRLVIGATVVPHPIVWQALFLAFLCGAEQYVCFTDHVIKRMENGKRLALFGAMFFLTIATFALLFRWFPMRPISWLIFIGIFLILFAIVWVVFHIYFRVTGKKYNQMLDAYQSRQDG